MNDLCPDSVEEDLTIQLYAGLLVILVESRVNSNDRFRLHIYGETKPFACFFLINTCLI